MEATTATTPNRFRPSQWIAFTLSAALGLALLATAPIRVMSEIATVRARTPILAAEDAVPVPIDRLEGAARQMEAERGLSPAPGDFAGRARILLALYKGPDTPAGQAELAAAAAAFRAVLTAAPLAPHVWSRLAYAEYARNRFEPAARAWRMSALTGSFDPELMTSRLEAGLALRPYMDVPARDALVGQIVLYQRWRPVELVALARRFKATAIVRQALASDAEAVADFERRLNQPPGKQ